MWWLVVGRQVECDEVCTCCIRERRAFWLTRPFGLQDNIGRYARPLSLSHLLFLFIIHPSSQHQHHTRSPIILTPSHMSAATAGFLAGPSRAHLDYRPAAPMPPPVQAAAPPASTKSPRKKAASMKSNKPQMPDFPPLVVDDEGVEWERVQLLGQVS